MVIGQTYYVQVSGGVGQTGTFNMIIRNNKDCQDCLNSSTLTVSPLPTAGTYSAGTTVTFCYHVAQYTQINTNWLHGVQMAFGSGWNLASLTTTPPPACQGTGYWQYYPGGVTSTATGTTFPAGFYFETVTGQNSPGNNFGDNCSGVQPAGTWNFCFSITTNAACTPGSNLTVTINTTGDGESGSWSSLGCVDDPATVFTAIGACCPPNMSAINATCAGNDGSATATPVGGASPYDFTWINSSGAIVSSTSSVAGANTATGLIPGTYSVQVVDNNGCLSSNTVTVGGTGGSIPVPTAGSNSPVCVGGTLNLTAATIPGATYSWAGPNSFTSSLQNPSITSVTLLAAGTYSVTATSGGCTNTSTTVVVVNQNPTANVPASATYCPGDPVPSGTFTSTPAGGTFNWTNTNTAIGLGAGGTGNAPAFTAANAGSTAISGTISVTASLSGCTGPPSTYTITVNPEPTVIVPANIIVCNGDAVPASLFGSTPAGASFSWTNSITSIGLGAGSTGNTPAFTAVNNGSAPVTATITVTPTLASCTGPAQTYTITVNPTPVADPVADISVCNGVTVPASAFTSTTAGTTFSWTNSNTSTGLGASGTGNTPAFTANNSTSGPIVSLVTVTPTANGCTGAPTNYDITVISNLIVNAGLDDTLCFGESTVLAASPSTAGSTFLWSPATGLSNTNTFNPIASPSVTTNYTITITDASGCTGTDDVTIYADPQITLAKTAVDVTCNGLCNGQTIVIPAGGTSPYTYSWTSGCVSAACNSLCPGSYTVTVTDAWGCTAQTDTVVSEPPVLTASITGTTPTSCNAVCDGTASGSASGGTPGSGYSYSWNSIPVQNTATATALCAGTYVLTVTDANSCVASINATITQPTPVTNAPISPATICIGASTTLNANPAGGSGGYVYTWDAPGSAGFANTASVTVTPGGTTTYTVHVQDVNGCAGPDVTVTVTVNPPLSVIAAGTASICPGTNAFISAAAAGGSGGPYTYNWAPTGTGSGTPVTVSPTSTTTYTVVATDGCGSPPAIDSVTITVLPVPAISFSSNDSTGCEPLCVTFADNSTISAGSITAWSWSFGDGTTSTIQNPSHCYNIAGSYDVSLIATSTAGCSTTYTSYSMIDVYPIPVAEFYTTPEPASILEPVVSFHNQSSSDVVSWTWNFGDGTSTGTLNPNPVHSYPTDPPSVYPAELVVISANGCRDSVLHMVTINPEFTFFIPNAFTPNDDGVNDYFFGEGVGILTYELMIFDRWGNMIFYSDDLYRKWDGKANHGSEVAQQDVYVWKVKLTDVFNKKHSYIGTVTLVK
jgi:gliding motility-associated-like protein